MQELSLRPHQAVFFAYEDYGNLIRLKDRSKLTWEALKPTGVLLISGLADATTMRSYISARVNDVQHLDYNDHHAYRESDLEHLMAQFERFHTDSKIIVTTEKDAQRLAKWLQNEKFADLPIYALQHRMRWFASEEESVENRLHGFIKAHTRNH
jgi:tetraacyldisaccharide 4'-kinase